MSQNFEELYNKLKEEYELSKKDNDEICKEYEATIDMLSESVESFKKEKASLITYADNDTSLSIIVIVAVVGITITGAYIYLMKGNNKK